MHKDLKELAARVALTSVPYPIQAPRCYGYSSYTELLSHVMQGDVPALGVHFELMEAVCETFYAAEDTIKELMKFENRHLLALFNMETER